MPCRTRFFRCTATASSSRGTSTASSASRRAASRSARRRAREVLVALGDLPEEEVGLRAAPRNVVGARASRSAARTVLDDLGERVLARLALVLGEAAPRGSTWKNRRRRTGRPGALMLAVGRLRGHRRSWPRVVHARAVGWRAHGRDAWSRGRASPEQLKRTAPRARRLPLPRRRATTCSTSARRSRCAPRVRSYFHRRRQAARDRPDGRADPPHRGDRHPTEVEALHLEQNLVKRHRPPFNVRLRDDKSFPYIAVTVEDEYPRVMFTRERHRRGIVYFGPYANAKKVRETLDVLNRVFRFRPCEGPKPGRHSASRASTSTSSAARRRASATSRRRTTAR